MLPLRFTSASQPRRGALLAIGLLLLAVSWLPPGHYPPWLSFQSEWLAGAGACFVGLGLLSQKRLAVPMLALLAAMVAVVPLVQTSLGQVLFVSDGVLSAVYVLAFALCVVAGATLAQTHRLALLDGLTSAFVAASVISVGIALHQWLQVGSSLYITDLRPGDRPGANIAQANHLSTLLALGVVGIVRWFETRRIPPAVAVVGIGWLGWGVVLTQSRTGWLFVAFMAGWVVVKHARIGLRSSRVAAVVAVLGFATGVGCLNLFNRALMSTTGGMSDRFSQGWRFTHWRTLADALSQSPWVGYGWGQVTLAQQAAVESHPATPEVLTNSHNLFLDLCIWNGLPIGLLLCVGLTGWLVRHVMVCKSIDQWTLIASIAAIAIHALLEYPLSYAYFLLPMGLMMGALDGLDEEQRRRTVSRVAFAALLIPLIALFAWVSVEYMRVEAAARQLRFVSAGIGTDRVATAPPPDVVLLDSLLQFHRFAFSEPKPGMSDAEIDWMRRVSTRYAFAPSMFRFAVASALNGRPDEATHTLARLCKMNAPIRCIEARETWKTMSERFAQMKGVALPDVPTITLPASVIPVK